MKRPCMAVSRALFAASLAMLGWAADAAVADFTNAAQLDVGGRHACAVTSTGAAKCWGDNTNGILGDGTTTARSWAGDVAGLTSGVNAVTTSRGWDVGSPEVAHSCALLMTGQVRCWGDNSFGQLGTGTAGGFSTTPSAPVALPSPAMAVSAGWGHTCALLVDGTVWCWGYNGEGQLGDGKSSMSGEASRPEPAQLPGLAGIVQISAGPADSCAVDASRAVKCWPMDVSGGQPKSIMLSGPAVSVSVGGTKLHTCSVISGTVGCTKVGPTPLPYDGGPHACAVLNSGAIQCWGNNNVGQLGDGSTTFSSTPTTVSGFSAGGLQVSAGGHRTRPLSYTQSEPERALDAHTCAVGSAGQVKCWGSNYCGVVSPTVAEPNCSTTGSTAVTTPISPGVSGAQYVAAGGEFACAMFASGTVSCWGLGYGATPLTVLVGTPPQAAAPDYGAGTGRLANLSTRGNAITGNEVLIGGFVIGGPVSKTVSIIASGPSLVRDGITGPLVAPAITLVRMSDQQIIATSDAWTREPEASQVQDSGFAPRDAAEAGVVITLPAGGYGALVSGANGGTGATLLAVYELDHPEVPVLNMSTRGYLKVGDDQLIGGLIIGGSTPQQVAIVATGPSLAADGVSGTLDDPRITLVRLSDHAVIATNDNWADDPNAAQLQAKGFAPSDSHEAGLLITLAPGAYGAIMTDPSGRGGIGLLSIYNAP